MKRLLDKLAIFLIGYGYVYMMLHLVSTIVYPKQSILFVLALSFASFLIISLAMSFKVTRIIFVSLLGLAALTIGGLYLFKLGGFITEQIEGIGTLWGKIYYSESIASPEMVPFATLFMVLTAIVVSMVVFLFFNKAFRFFILSAIGISIQIFAWVMTGKENKAVFAIFCVLTIISYIRHVYEKKYKHGLATDQKVSGSLMLFSIPLAIIPVLAIMLMPKSDLPIQWPWLDQKIMKVIELIEQRFSQTNVEFFSLSSTGFNGRSQRLGGPVRPSNTIVMDVKADKRTYLRGAAYTWYENNTWSQIRNDRLDVVSSKENERELTETRQGWLYIPVADMFTGINPDDFQMLMGLSSGRYNTLLFPTYSLSVHYRNMTTRSMFIPIKTLLPVKDENGNNMKVNENIHGVVISTEKLPTGANYTYKYVQPMYGEPMLKKALTYSRGNLYQDALTQLYKKRNALIQEQIQVGALPVESDSDSDVVQSDSIDSKNDEAIGDVISNQNPADETEETDFAVGTVEQANEAANSINLNNIDAKINALEDLYARAKRITIDYTQLNDTIPQRVRELALDITKDCTNNYEKVLKLESYLRTNYEYTLNASRVPEGQDFVDYFLFDEKKGYCTYFATAMTVLARINGIPARYVEGYVLPEEVDDKGIYTVTNRHAHAWTEVYFEGFGWLTFEPTAIYAGVMDYRSSVDAVTIPNYDVVDAEELMRRFYERNDIPGYVPVAPVADTGNKNQLYIKYALFGIGSLVIVLVTINLIAGLIGMLILIRLKSKKRVLKVYRMMLKWLENAGYTIKDGETVTEFANRMDRRFALDPTTFEEITRTFSKVRYGDHDVETDEVKQMLAGARSLKKQVLREMGFKRFMPLRRIILGI